MQTNPDVREMPRLLDEAIEDLPEELRQPIVAHFLYGRSHGAIARDMGIPRRTVGNRIQRGLAQLGALLRTRGVTASAAAVAAALTSAKAGAAALPVALSESWPGFVSRRLPSLRAGPPQAPQRPASRACLRRNTCWRAPPSLRPWSQAASGGLSIVTPETLP